jgi:hypothetical protein
MGQRPWVNDHHLLHFKTIAQDVGIAKAAKKLRLVQPTIWSARARWPARLEAGLASALRALDGNGTTGRFLSFFCEN